MHFEATPVGSFPVAAARDGDAAGRDPSRLWHAVLGRLQFEVSPANFETWLRPTKPVGFDGASLTVEASSSFAAVHLSDGLGVVVGRVVDELFGPGLAVRFVPRQAETGSNAGRTLLSTVPVAGAINPAYRFETFHPGEGNRAAFGACQALAGEGVGLSPLVIWGGSGMGKSHLLHAAAAAACARGWRVGCLGAEEFTTLYMSAVRRESIEDFQRLVRGVRLLAVDDIQYFAGKRGTVDEFIHTMDAVANAGGAVVVASDVHPSQLPVPDRLRSRLAAGFATEMLGLAREERLAFVVMVASDLRTPLPGWALERIAGIEATATRPLRGAVCAAVGLQRAGLLEPRRLDAELVRVVGGFAQRSLLSDRDLLAAIAEHFGVGLDDLAGRSRQGRVRDARAAAVAGLKARGLSLAQVAAMLGNRDRSTVSGLADRGRQLFETTPALRQLLAG